MDSDAKKCLKRPASHPVPRDHPLQISLRTYALSLSLSLGPALFPFLTSAKLRRNGVARLKKILRRELGMSGFAFAMTVAVGGGATLRRLWDLLDTKTADDTGWASDTELTKIRDRLSSLTSSHRTFIANVLSSLLAITLFHSRRSRVHPSHRVDIPLTLPLSDTASPQLQRARIRPSITLDLTLLLLVRAMDSLFQMAISRLPRSYNKWIMTLANIDVRLLEALRAIRSGAWSYRRHVSVQPDLVSSISRTLGYPSAWGDPALLPAYGGVQANAVWKTLGVRGRNGLGGLPCELVHGTVTGGSCTANATIRGAQAFVEALALYLPVHFLPILLTRPRALLQAPRLLRTTLSVLRSASFLSAFVSSIWVAVCLTRTLFLARLFPWISHDFWDGPFGCTFVGSLVCGGSIWIEEGRRRG
ncbi:uncharacterized protein FIBRA_00965 [Fibroporia radiculosa]|uniref:Transmembrane protein 135 N-terminal domain-containing protein n=1 Tax=Fibroporia radiculosa TaxID=599839 RepID=J4HSJ3_9APHY|nr:uncharacterized protein FIBRA_00965 [Fibroporia radiculosa]CCL98957.1 predicted protein [Fibroporia radiculosa]